MNQTRPDAVRLQQVRRSFGDVEAVRGIDLVVRPGELVGVAGVADEDDVTALFVGALGLFVDLGYQRTGRVDVVEPARFGLGRNRLWNAVRTEHDRNAVGHLIERFDENRPLRLQRFNDIAVMDDLVPDIDGGAITLDRQLDDADRPVDAGAKAAWGGHQNLEFRGFGGGLRKICHDPRALAQRP